MAIVFVVEGEGKEGGGGKAVGGKSLSLLDKLNVEEGINVLPPQ